MQYFFPNFRQEMMALKVRAGVARAGGSYKPT